ncbi:hypothetical protein [Ohtaekwangia koreensis]|uniref:Uncharacterized protein n=1 Tax=Ohtaekwangia koreensis TaxID=688867 RepID=A0A1T5KDB3_9BACT|nr:hypothetical protein [Ohtaekwangia koreensis]SKC61509.1 hypothetical protein SAMN05660236_2044 [Ohtaekwangia koreensis]
MRTSLNDIALAEKYLLGKLEPEETLVFEARLLTNPVLRWNVAAQKKVYSVLKLYHRKKLKKEVQVVHQTIFNDAKHQDFKQEILQLFK